MRPFPNCFVIGFQTQLSGGLNCRSGEFHADGVYGVPGPNLMDPGGDAIIAAPLGGFDGTLDGLHGGAVPQVISGTWDLTEDVANYNCNGPFTVELQP